MRRDQVREAGAANGTSPSVRTQAMTRALVPTGFAVAGAAAIWNATDTGQAGWRLAAIMSALLIAALACLSAYVRMRRHAEGEDDGLLPRLKDLRTRLVMDRRQAILEGREAT